MTKPFVPCLIVSKRWFLIGLLFQLPFFTVPSKPGHGIRLDLTKVDDRGLLAATDRVRRAAGRAVSWPARRGHGALRIDCRSFFLARLPFSKTTRRAASLRCVARRPTSQGRVAAAITSVAARAS